MICFPRGAAVRAAVGMWRCAVCGRREAKAAANSCTLQLYPMPGTFSLAVQNRHDMC